MTKTLFSITEIDRLLNKDRAENIECRNLKKEIHGLKEQLAVKEARLAELEGNRWATSPVMNYLHNCVEERIKELYAESDKACKA